MDHVVALSGASAIVKTSVADISKAKRKLHYGPKVLLIDGLEEITKSYSI